jgi:hypothetical protein
MTVEIPLSVADLAGTLGVMRDWLDENQCTPARFETRSAEQPGAMLIIVEFRESAEAEAEAFRLAFDAGGSERSDVAA